MGIDIHVLKKMLEDDKQLKKNKQKRILPDKKTCDDKYIISQLENTLLDSKNIIAPFTLDKTIPFILWNNFWNLNGIFSSVNEEDDEDENNGDDRRYNRGAKIYVNFGCGNINTELSYPHPSIVVCNFAKNVVVIPTTSDDKKSVLKDEFANAIIKVKGDNNIFHNDSIINIPQIRLIDKERIISNLKCNVQNYILDDQEIDRLNKVSGVELYCKGMNLWECIELKLIDLFTRNGLTKINSLIKENEQLTEKVQLLTNVINSMLKQSIDNIENLKKYIDK